MTVVMKGESLSGVGDDDMLIIAGHGLPNSSKTGVTTEPANAVATYIEGHGTQTCCTASDLAALLARADLPLGHRYIKLITGGGAGMASVDDANATFNADRIKVIGVTAATQTHEAECIASVLAIRRGDQPPFAEKEIRWLEQSGGTWSRLLEEWHRWHGEDTS